MWICRYVGCQVLLFPISAGGPINRRELMKMHIKFETSKKSEVARNQLALQALGRMATLSTNPTAGSSLIPLEQALGSTGCSCRYRSVKRRSFKWLEHQRYTRHSQRCYTKLPSIPPVRRSIYNTDILVVAFFSRVPSSVGATFTFLSYPHCRTLLSMWGTSNLIKPTIWFDSINRMILGAYLVLSINAFNPWRLYSTFIVNRC